MSLSVSDRVRMLATFRFVEVRLMETAAGWTPTTAEMEIKVLFGRHIFDFAQHADWIGKRTFELRKPEHYTVKPMDSYVGVMDAMAAEEDTPRRLSALYEVFLPALERHYRSYLEATDRLLDEPSVVIIERILGDLTRMKADAQRARATLALPNVPLADLTRAEGSHEAIFAT